MARDNPFAASAFDRVRSRRRVMAVGEGSEGRHAACGGRPVSTRAWRCLSPLQPRPPLHPPLSQDDDTVPAAASGASSDDKEERQRHGGPPFFHPPASPPFSPSASAWDAPPPPPVIGVSDVDAAARALDARERDLAAREAAVARAEADLRRGGGAASAAAAVGGPVKNWPRCCPFVHHDIAGEVPASAQGAVRAAYWAFLGLVACLLFNTVAVFVRFAVHKVVKKRGREREKREGDETAGGGIDRKFSHLLSLPPFSFHAARPHQAALLPHGRHLPVRRRSRRVAGEREREGEETERER